MIGRPDFDRNGADLAGDMIPCLSIRQPYAWLIVQGIKPVENRTWRTSFRGRVLIHAGVTYAKRDHAGDYESWAERGYPRSREEMVGGIVGEAVIVDCVKTHPSPFFCGPYGFVLEHAKAFPRLIPIGGRLGFFGVPATILDGVEGASEPCSCPCCREGIEAPHEYHLERRPMAKPADGVKGPDGGR